MESFLSFMFHVCLNSTLCSLVVTCWERVDLLALLCVMFLCVLSFSHMVSRVRRDTPGVCLLYFHQKLRELTEYNHKVP